MRLIFNQGGVIMTAPLLTMPIPQMISWLDEKNVNRRAIKW